MVVQGLGPCLVNPLLSPHPFRTNPSGASPNLDLCQLLVDRKQEFILIHASRRAHGPEENGGVYKSPNCHDKAPSRRIYQQ
eukprot:5905527-Amphidinium_carterae.2